MQEEMPDDVRPRQAFDQLVRIELMPVLDPV